VVGLDLWQNTGTSKLCCICRTHRLCWCILKASNQISSFKPSIR